MAGIFSLRNWVMKQLMKQDKSGIMRIPDKGKIDFGEMLLKEQLFNKGIDPRMIKNDKQLDNILDTPVVPKSERVKPKKPGKVIKVDFDKGRWNKAQGGSTGLSFLLAEDSNQRVPLKDGHSPGRRKFLKVAAGLASIPVVGKFFKWAKPAAKVADVTSVPIKNISGMPAWFKPLVNKVIKEGTEVPSGAERVIVHKTKLPNSKTDVYVNQDLNTGDVWVDLGVEKHGFPDGKFGQPVRLEYKASEWIEPPIVKEGKVAGHGKGTKTKEEFNVEEAEFTGGHPENVKFEESVIEKFGDHASNFDEVEMFATGKVKKVTTKSSLQKQNEDLADHFSNYPEPDDFASGGRVPRSSGLAGMLGE